MKIPFWENEREDFFPRIHPGQNPKLSAEQKMIVDALDVFEQRLERSSRISVRANNMALLALGLLIMVAGKQVLEILIHYMGGTGTGHG